MNHDIHGTRLYLVGLKADGTLDGDLKAAGVAPDVRIAVWAPSSDKMLVVTEPMNDLSDLGPAGQAFVVDAESADKPQKLDAIPPTVGNIAFAPDESTIVFSAATKEDAPPGYDELYALPKESSGSKVIPLSSEFVGQLGFGPLYFSGDGTRDCAGRDGDAYDAGAADAGREQAAGAGGPGRGGDWRAEYESQENGMGVDGGERRRAGKAVLCRAPGRRVHGVAHAGAGIKGSARPWSQSW